jgi:glycosyltransferase involved in cell wall biosynthesis
MNLSIIIPTHNRKDNILNTLTCIARQVIQPQHKIEVIVVDHESTDGTTQVILDREAYPYPFKLVRIPRKAWDAATPRNYGAKITNPDFDAIYFLDSDILLPPDRIQRLIDDYLINPDPNRVIVGPYHNMSKPVNIENKDWYKETITDYTKDVRWKSFTENEVSNDVAKGNQGFGYALACFGGSMMVNRSLFFRSGGYDETMINGGEDGDFGLTLWECGAVVSMDQGLLGWHQPHEIDVVRKATPFDTIARIDAKHNVDVIKETGKNFRTWGIPWTMPQLEDAPKVDKTIGELEGKEE